MGQSTRIITCYSLGGFSAIIVTAMLFMALPLLTKIQPPTSRGTNDQYILINTQKPAPPREETDQSKLQEMVEKEPPKKASRPRRERPSFDLLKTTIDMGQSGVDGIEIGMVKPEKISEGIRDIVFNPNEVDQPPRYLRTFQPQYPYIAKRDNIEGSVKLRFVVDVDGLAKEIEVVEAEPEGFFEEAALKTIERYKFKPAVKNGEPVLCNAWLTFTFTLDK